MRYLFGNNAYDVLCVILLLQAVLKELGLKESSKRYFALFKVNKDGFSESCVDD